MKSLKHLMLIASLVAMPALSFAQQMTTPTNGAATAPTTPLHDAQGNQASHDSSRYSADRSGYGAPATSSSQSSARRSVGKHSQAFEH